MVMQWTVTHQISGRGLSYSEFFFLPLTFFQQNFQALIPYSY